MPRRQRQEHQGRQRVACRVPRVLVVHQPEATHLKEDAHRLALRLSALHRPAMAAVAVEAEEVVAAVAEAEAPTITTCPMAMTRVGKVASGISMTRSTT